MDDRSIILNYLKRLLLPLERVIAADQLPTIPQPCYGEGVAKIETISRLLWGLLPLIMAGENVSQPLVSFIISKIKLGTSPNSPLYWGPSVNFDQKIVEAVPIALSVSLASSTFWEPLSPVDRNNLIQWLDQSCSVQVYENNWICFQLLIHESLVKLGHPSKFQQKECLEKLDSFYLGDGWYRDGFNYGDYYNAMGFHFYSLILHRFFIPNERRFPHRAILFAEQFQYYFSSEGEPIAFGRSLTYKLALGCFWGALATVETIDDNTMSIAKSIYMNHAKWWSQLQVQNAQGLLHNGYGYENIFVTEEYNGPGSPYWAFKFFWPLILSPDHRFWNVPEYSKDALHTLKRQATSIPFALKVIVTASPQYSFMLNAGQSVCPFHRNSVAKYQKFVYSTMFSFCVSQDAWSLAFSGSDNVLLLSDDDKKTFRTRSSCVDAKVEDNVAFSRWKPWEDVEIDTWLIPYQSSHVRIHKVHSQRQLFTVETGFAIDDSHSHHYGGFMRNEKTFSGIFDITHTRSFFPLRHAVNSNICHPSSVSPALKGSLPVGVHIMGTLVSAGHLNFDVVESQNFAIEVDWQRQLISLSQGSSLIWSKHLALQ